MSATAATGSSAGLPQPRASPTQKTSTLFMTRPSRTGPNPPLGSPPVLHSQNHVLILAICLTRTNFFTSIFTFPHHDHRDMYSTLPQGFIPSMFFFYHIFGARTSTTSRAISVHYFILKLESLSQVPHMRTSKPSASTKTAGGHASIRIGLVRRGKYKVLLEHRVKRSASTSVLFARPRLNGLMTGMVEKIYVELAATGRNVEHIKTVISSLAVDHKSHKEGVEGVEDNPISLPAGPEERSRDIRKRLSAPDFEKKHVVMFGRHTPGSREWFLRDPKYVAWWKGERNILWCPGNRRWESSRPTLEESWDSLNAEVGRYLRVFIVLDGLDETTDWIPFLERLRNSPTARILATSRNLGDIAVEFEKGQRLEIVAQEDDIRKYVSDCLTESVGRFKRLLDTSTRLLVGVSNGVVKRAHGMLLLAQFHMNVLKAASTVGDLRQALGQLPEDLELVCNGKMDQIPKKDKLLARVDHPGEDTYPLLGNPRRQANID
ncbi:hypothetical protein BD779DRAFT_1672109 [Infundibulicybe gibba]|nr:hypothetical protein BD779DRAFT_1672109 [Infundibulicybe gibba]